MNTANLKKIAPRARTAFITAIKARAAEFGITAKGHIEPVISGEVLQVAGFTHPASCASALKRLQQRLANDSYETLIEHVAYTWFNRFCAIRFMELKSEEGYLEHGVRLLSHPSQPLGFEVLDRAPEVIDNLITEGVALDKSALLDLLLAGNEQEALFRELLLGQCHRLHQAMPFLFEAIDDETELLLPAGLTRTDAFWRELVDKIPEADWQQVEVIGWLYQFYILDEKERVDKKVKAGKVVNPTEIPAKTQLFTPNWIVQYLVQNSIGRYWLQTYPNSSLQQSMHYYVVHGNQSTELKDKLSYFAPDSIDPESIKVLDPACGSGHILVESYNLLYRIYEERGYRSREIPELILKHNLFGLDIDERAAQLAGFALLMRARQDDRRLFTRGIRPHIHVLQESRHLNISNLWQMLNLNTDWTAGQVQDMFTVLPQSLVASNPHFSLLNDLYLRFLDAKTLGSLIELPTEQKQIIHEFYAILQDLSISGDAMQKTAAKALLPLLAQADVLCRHYDAVIANPPYMGGNSMNYGLKKFAEEKFPDSKLDMFTMFIERGFKLVGEGGFNAMVTMETWMFLSSYKKFRLNISSCSSIVTLAHLEKMLMGIAFRTVATVWKNIKGDKTPGIFSFVGKDDVNKNGIPFLFPPKNKRLSYISSYSFENIPGAPIAYWLPVDLQKSFKERALNIECKPRIGMQSGDNEKFYRLWHEVNNSEIVRNISALTNTKGKKAWVPLQRGGDARKWYGNNLYIVNLSDEGADIKRTKNASLRNADHYFNISATWNRLSQTRFYVRHVEQGYAFDDLSPFANSYLAEKHYEHLGLLASSAARYLISFISTGRKTEVGHVSQIPLPTTFNSGEAVSTICKKLIELSKNDWNSYEESAGFIKPSLLDNVDKINSLCNLYKKQCASWQRSIFEMQRLEEENNRLFIEAYSLQTELTPEVSINEITLTCNPYYRYGGNRTDEELKAMLQSDTVAELISYTIGCIMGRYSLDREGLVYAHAGNEDFKALVEEGAYARFPADSDGILPLTVEAWFEDDIAARVVEFVRTVWGVEHLEENLQFIADSLCLAAIKPVKKGGETSRETIRRYLSTQFFKDHLKTYKKRPIYWLFSSGKEKAFECLVYLHRYNETTLPRMRTEYVTPLLGQMDSRIERLRLQQNEAETAEAKRIGKEIDSLTKQLTELRSFDDQLKHYADMKIQLDLDDGVKVNYGKFGTLLAEVKAITGDKAE
jgi:hypothetical protein